MNEVHVIPFPGKPLEYEGAEASRTLFTAPERGFLIGPENYALEPVVRWVVDGEMPEDRLPVLLYGPIGTGRTHLLHGIIEAWRKNQPSDAQRRRSYLLSASDFARVFSDAMTTKTTNDFRRRYRKAALLLIDDLDLLHDKPWAQEELQHTLDAVTKAEGMPVLTAGEIPRTESGFLPSLADRLIGGTTLPVALPGPAVRKRFLKDLASAFRVKLPEPTIDHAAETLAVTLPALYGTFARMYFDAEAAGVSLDTAFLRRFLKNREQVRRPGIKEIARKTAKHFSLELADLKGTSRNKTVSLARSVAAFLAKHQAGANLKDIAKYFGNRDPSTVRYLIEKIRKGQPDDAELRDHLYRLGWR